MTRVDHVQQEIRLVHFFERRAEARDQIVRQLANESNGIGQQNLRVLAEVYLARQRIERREQPVFDKDFGRIPDRAQNRRLAGVGVADERSPKRFAPAGPLNHARRLNVVELVLEQLDALVDQPPVGLELSFSRAPDSDAAAEFLQVGPHAHEPRQHVL